MQRHNRNIKICAYVDNTVIGSTSIQDLHHSFNDLIQWAEENSLQMNTEKTEMVVFRKGKKVKQRDRINYGQERLITTVKEVTIIKLLYFLQFNGGKHII
jgi:hypothetical protein